MNSEALTCRWLWLMGSLFCLSVPLSAWGQGKEPGTLWGGVRSLLPPEWEWEPLLTVPRLEGRFRMDGVLADNEWQFATQVGGLLDANTLRQAGQSGRFLLGYRGQDLFLGFEFNRPPGSGAPRIRVDQPGWSATPLWVQDENLEVWLAPFTDGVKMGGMMEPAYAVAANAAGAYSHDLTGWDRTEIPRELEYVPILRTEQWQGEMRFPWSVLSQMRVPQEEHPPADGVEWKGAFFFQQLTPFRALIGPQQTLDAFPTLIFSERPVGFEVSAVEPAEAGQARFVAGVRNGSAETVEYALHYEIFRRTEPPRSEAEQFVSYWRWIERIKAVGPDRAAAERGGVLDVRSVEGVEADLNRQYRWVDGGVRPLTAEPGQVARAEVVFPAPDGYYLFGYRIVERGTGRVAMRQVIPVLLARLPVQVRPEFLKAQKIIVRVDVGAVRGLADGDVLEVRLLDGQGQPLAEHREVLKVGAGRVEVLLSSEKTQENQDYEARARVLSGKRGEILAETSQAIHRPPNPEWWGNNLGRTDRLPPGFEPVRAVEHGLEVALRRFVLDGVVFPQQIVTRGEPFLAGPIQLTAEVGGQSVPFSRGPLEMGEVTPTGAVFRQQWSGAGLRLNLEGRLEYDGFLRYDIAVGPVAGPVRLDRLTLEVPVRAEYARWYAHRDLSTRLAGAPKGPYFPYGDLEDFYRAYPDGWMPFSWQLFLGTRDRGIEWVAESDRAWSPRDEARMMGLQRGEGQVCLVFRFIDAPVELAAPRMFSFALMPTPVRDFPRARYYSLSRTLGASLGPDTPQNPEQSPEIEGIYRELQQLGFRVAHHYVNFGPELFSNVRFYDERHLNPLRGVNRLAHQYGLINVFYCGYSLPPGIPDNETFGQEMRMEPEYRGWYNHASPFADYFLHSAKFMCENAGVDAFHTDGLAMVWLMNNPTYDFGWTRDGQPHGTYPVFAVRDLFKRFYTMLKFELADGREGYHMPHVTDAPVYCLESLSDLAVTGEQHYNTLSTLKDLSLARYGLCYDTLWQGVPRMGIWHYTQDIPVTKNVMLTLHNLHGVMYEYVNLRYSNFPYELMGGFRPEVVMWRDFNRRTADFLPHWAAPNLAEVASDVRGVELPDGAIKVSAYVHQEARNAVLIVANLEPVGYSVRVKPNLEAMGLPGAVEDYSFTDPVLDGYYYPMVGSEIRLDLYPQRWRAIGVRER